MIEVRLFGDLRRYAADSASVAAPTPRAEGALAVLHIPVDGGQTVGQIVAQLGIEPAELGNIFLNGRMLPRSAYAVTMGYQMTSNEPLSLEGCLDTSLQPGDRLGVFPRIMSSVVV
jgi:hypothetical protein